MWDNRWQLVSRDTSDLFGIIRGDETWLSTVEMPYLGVNQSYVYESCLFYKGGSEVLERYSTRADAMTGHAALAKKYNLV